MSVPTSAEMESLIQQAHTQRVAMMAIRQVVTDAPMDAQSKMISHAVALRLLCAFTSAEMELETL